jgi:hypothetical protein
VLEQEALASHGEEVHSLTSLQEKPVPLYPALQAQLKPPSLLEQEALASQLLLPEAHSSLSLQVYPSPE